jgi:hypothetical protein
MRREDAHQGHAARVTAAREMRARLSEVDALYARLDALAGAGAWNDAAAVLARLDELVRGLGSIDAGRRAARTAGEVAEWTEIDVLARAVIAGHARALRNAETARQAAAAALAHAHTARDRAARYHPATTFEAFFTSRTV